MIRLNCFFQANSEENYISVPRKRGNRRGLALRAAVALTEKSRKHEGNIAYDTFQSATRSDVFMICETWENQEVLDKHSATPEFAENVAIIGECGEMKIESFDF